MNLLKRIAVLAVAALSLLAVHAQSRDSITTVYVIFKTHLDVGFTDLSSKVEQNYLNEFIPKALDVAERLRADRSGERYVWTTGPGSYGNTCTKPLLPTSNASNAPYAAATSSGTACPTPSSPKP